MVDDFCDRSLSTSTNRGVQCCHLWSSAVKNGIPGFPALNATHFPPHLKSSIIFVPRMQHVLVPSTKPPTPPTDHFTLEPQLSSQSSSRSHSLVPIPPFSGLNRKNHPIVEPFMIWRLNLDHPQSCHFLLI